MKVAEVALAATFTEEGTVSTLEAVLASATTVLLEDALDKLTLQGVLALEARVAAAH